MEGVPQDSGHIRALDGIRGFAVLLVFCFHGLTNALTPTNWLVSGVRDMALEGWVGVDLFFVLSGFLITTILLDARKADNYFRVFYARRVLRIFPLYYLVLIAAMVWFPGDYTFREQMFYWLNLSNLPTAFGRIMSPHLLHFWSLGIEEQFYLVWPLMVRRLKARSVAVVCVAVIVGLAIARNVPALLAWNARSFEVFYRLTPFRVDGLCGGALLALVVRYRPRLVEKRVVLRTIFLLALCVFLASGNDIRSTSFIRFGYTALVICFTALTALALFPGGWTSRFFSQRPLRMLGRYSYGIYLIHPFLLDGGAAIVSWIEVWLMRRHLLGRGLSLNASALVSVALAFGLTLGLSMVSWRFFEGPILKYKRHFRYEPRPERYLA